MKYNIKVMNNGKKSLMSRKIRSLALKSKITFLGELFKTQIGMLRMSNKFNEM